MDDLRKAIRKGDVREVRRLRALSQGTVTAVVDQPEKTIERVAPKFENDGSLTLEPIDIDEPNHPEHEE